jgi:hypothetical protein
MHYSPYRRPFSERRDARCAFERRCSAADRAFRQRHYAMMRTFPGRELHDDHMIEEAR